MLSSKNIVGYLFFLLLLSLSTVAVNDVQAQKVSLSPMNLDDSGMDYAKVLGQDDGGVYVIMSNLSFDITQDRVGLRSRKYRLLYVDQQLKMRWWKNVVPHPEDAETEGIVFFQGHPVAIHSTWERQTGKFTFTIDVFDSTGISIISGREVARLELNRNATLIKPRFQLSAGREKLAFLLEEVRDKSVRIYVNAIDQQYAPCYAAAANVNYPRKDIESGQFGLSENFDLGLLVFARKADSNSKEWKRQRDVLLMYLKKGQSEFREFRINDDQQPMYEAALSADPVNEQLVVTGFYADKNSYAGTGILYARLALNGSDSIKRYFNPLGGDAQVKLLGERNAGNSIGLYTYPIQQLILRSDGGAVLLAEAEYLSEYSYYDYFTQSFNKRTEFHFDNVVVLSLNNKGRIDWGQVLRKDQASLDDGGIYASFCNLLNEEEMILLYNNDIGRNNAVTGFSVSAEGKQSNLRFTKSGENVSIMPRAGKQVSEDSIVVPVLTKKKLYLARFSRN